MLEYKITIETKKGNVTVVPVEEGTLSSRLRKRASQKKYTEGVEYFTLTKRQKLWRKSVVDRERNQEKKI